MSKRILVIDDEQDLIELVRYNLEREGFDVVAAADGQEGLKAAMRSKPDLIVLDLMMPGTDGLTVCRELRNDNRTQRIPVIMLTAKAAEVDRIVGLEMGADDYVTKPFSPRELVARVKAILRRGELQDQQPQLIRRGKLAIDLQGRAVRYDEKPVTVTATEFKILQALASRPGRVFSRQEIIDAALGRDVVVYDRTIDVHMTGLRKKLGRGGEMIETVRGFGYKLNDATGEDESTGKK